MSEQYRSILVFRSAALGDFILGCPALAVIRQTYPNSRIVFLTIQSASKTQREKVAAYAGTDTRVPWVEMAMPHLIDETVVSNDLTSISGIFAMRRHLRGRNFHKAILLVESAYPWLGRLKKLLLIQVLIGPVSVLGWRGKGSLKGDHAKLQRDGILQHHVHGALQFLSELDPPVPYTDADIKFDLRPGSNALQWVAEWIDTNIPDDIRLVIVAPGSIQPHKRWPLDKFRKLCAGILSTYSDVVIVVLGTPLDASLGDELCLIDPKRVFNLAGKTSIAQSAALLKNCALLVGNDGGAMHLGDAMGARVVSIIPGLEYPDSIEPWHNKKLAIRHPVSCAPCYNFVRCPEGHNRCMIDLPLERVLSNCMSVLSLQVPIRPSLFHSKLPLQSNEKNVSGSSRRTPKSLLNPFKPC